MNIYVVTLTVEFSVVASSRRQAEKFARASIEERCVTLEDAEMNVAKVQFVEQRHRTATTENVNE